ncbi:uncharacterized protein FOMMEDRAFT_92323, partial [Fomitiporia mediterranea MF3/22]|uniref:uncharacterized protein n=1 Tax=Fomitiporia mediterranea (strain MF3/22) TaxID=694068 RepID=UPI00044075C2
VSGMLAGTWANSLLLSVAFMQALNYFQNYPRDPIQLRAAVALVILFNVWCTIVCYANVYLYCVTHWGNQVFLSAQYWPVPNYIISTSLSGFLVQTFLGWRFLRLSSNYIITGLLELCSLASLGGSVAVAVIITTHNSLADRNMLTTTVTVWFVASAATDVFISIVLIWQFRRMKSFFDNTRSLLRRLTALTIRSGSMTSTIALTTLFLFLADNEANWATGVVWTLGPMYAITMLSNLNARRRLHGVGQSSDEHNPSVSSGGVPPFRRNHEETFAMSGIHVIRTVQLSDDVSQPFIKDFMYSRLVFSSKTVT